MSEFHITQVEILLASTVNHCLNHTISNNLHFSVNGWTFQDHLKGEWIGSLFWRETTKGSMNTKNFVSSFIYWIIIAYIHGIQSDIMIRWGQISYLPHHFSFIVFGTFKILPSSYFETHDCFILRSVLCVIPRLSCIIK